MVLDVTATGKAGHAARNEGDNAIYKVLDDIAWFHDYRFEKESPLLGPVKMSVTVINAGTQHNVIPDKCSFFSLLFSKVTTGIPYVFGNNFLISS